jgi:pimeloyl-ACP methyl ester carboxylesterase
MTKIPVYFMPGLAASSSIFERIVLPSESFEVILLDWVQPKKDETLVSYAQRMAQKVVHENAVLIGVSFGGILVQEMTAFLTLKKLIIISSVKTRDEMPRRIKFAKTTNAYKLLPTSLLNNVEKLIKYSFGNVINQKLKLYEKFLHLRNKEYLDWAIEQVVCWERSIPDPMVIHIHGDLDEVFPAKNIKSFIAVKGGTHIMILMRFRWFNQYLPDIILNPEI